MAIHRRSANDQNLDGLAMDGHGGIVESSSSDMGMTPEALAKLDTEISTLLVRTESEEHHLQQKVAHILVTHLTHEERMCALHTFYQADVAPCSGEKLCRLQKRVLTKLRGIAEMQSLWHLL